MGKTLTLAMPVQLKKSLTFHGFYTNGRNQSEKKCFGTAENTTVERGVIQTDYGVETVFDATGKPNVNAVKKAVKAGTFANKRFTLTEDNTLYVYNDATGDFEQKIQFTDSADTVVAVDGDGKIRLMAFGGDKLFSVSETGTTRTTVLDNTGHGEYYHERLFLADKTKLRFSAPTDFNNFTDSCLAGGTVDLTGKHGDIVGMKSLNETLYVFCRRGVYKVKAQGKAEDFVVEEISYDGGEILPYSVARSDNKIGFLTKDGIYLFDGTTAEKVFDTAFSDWANGRSTAYDGKLYFYAKPVSSTFPVVLILDTKTLEVSFNRNGSKAFSSSADGLYLVKDKLLLKRSVSYGLPTFESYSFQTGYLFSDTEKRKHIRFVNVEGRGRVYVVLSDKNGHSVVEKQLTDADRTLPVKERLTQAYLTFTLEKGAYVEGLEIEYRVGKRI